MACSSSSIALLKRVVSSCGDAQSLIMNNNKFLHALLPLQQNRSFSNWVPQHNRDYYRSYGGNFDPIKVSSKEGKDGLHMKLNMPGLGKENINVYLENYTMTKLIIEQKTGYSEEEEDYSEDENLDDEEEQSRRLIYERGLKPGFYKTDQIKTEIKNGQLNVFLPKEEEEINKIEYVNLLGDYNQLVTKEELANKEESGHNNNALEKSDTNLDISAPTIFSNVFDDVFPRIIKDDLPWKAEHEDGVYVGLNMPGLGKEDVEVTMELEQKMLSIKEVGYDEDEAESSEGKHQRTARRSIKLSPTANYNKDQIIAEMKNGVLGVFVPVEKVDKFGVEVKGE